MEPVWNAIQTIGKWWSRKQRESEDRLLFRAQQIQERELELYPNWEDHRG